MNFNRFFDVHEFKSTVYDYLMEDEVLNNLQLSIVNGTNIVNGNDNSEWLMSVVTDDGGAIVLIAICTKPFNLLLYEPRGKALPGAIEFLARQLRHIGYQPPGVFAPSDLAHRFASAYSAATCQGDGSIDRLPENKVKMRLILMKLEKLADYKKAPGEFRFLEEGDLSFLPKWERQFCIDCNLPLYSEFDTEARIRGRLGKDTHFIWVDGQPVAQAAFGRETPGIAVVNWVYTPLPFRARGYATSVVAEVSRAILARGKRCACLFADAANKTSCSVYRKLGYEDVCVFDEIKF